MKGLNFTLSTSLEEFFYNIISSLVYVTRERAKLYKICVGNMNNVKRDSVIYGGPLIKPENAQK